MRDLEMAFKIAHPKKMISVDAEVNQPPYVGMERIVIHRLWNGKTAIFRQSFTAKDTGDKLFQTEEYFWASVAIKKVYSLTPEAEKRPEIEALLTPLLVG